MYHMMRLVICSFTPFFILEKKLISLRCGTSKFALLEEVEIGTHISHFFGFLINHHLLTVVYLS